MKTIFPSLVLLPLILAVSSCQNQRANRSGGSDGYQDYGYVPSESSSQSANNPYATDSAYGSYQKSAPGSRDQDYVNAAPTGSQAPGNATQMPAYQDSLNPLPSYGHQAPAATGGSAQSHVVSQGETLYRISKIYGSTVEGIKNANSLNSNLIHPGDILSIP